MSPVLIAYLPAGVIGCLSCNEDLRAAIIEHRFVLLLLTIAPITLIGGLLAGWVASLVSRVAARGTRLAEGPSPAGWERFAWAAAVTGAGLGALFDGILLHQILQVHDMISNSLPSATALGKGVNLFWSGIFDLAVFVLILLGIASYHRHSQARPPPPARFFWGAFLLGWGLFNGYDVLTFHGLLRYHDVVEVTASPFAWNLGWFSSGAVIALVGFVLMRREFHARVDHEPGLD